MEVEVEVVVVMWRLLMLLFFVFWESFVGGAGGEKRLDTIQRRRVQITQRGRVERKKQAPCKEGQGAVRGTG